jgi:hypothetical protein
MAVSFRESLTSIAGSALVGVASRAQKWAETPEPPKKPNSYEYADGMYGSSADLALISDDFGWIPEAMSYGNPGARAGDISPAARIATVRRARVYYVQDAMSKQAIELYTTYCVGQGMSIKARDYKNSSTDPVGDTTDDASDFGDEQSPETVALQQEANDFWEHPDNSPVFSTEAQSINSNKLSVEGELFYILIPPTGAVTIDGEGNLVDHNDNVTRVRLIKDCLQMGAIFYNPEDDSEPWYYLRQWVENGEVKKRLYPDHRLFFKSQTDAEGKRKVSLPPTPRNTLVADAKVMTTQFVYHQKINTISERGNSTLATVMDWSKTNRKYLEDRATISAAHARIAWKRIIKGPANKIAEFGKRAISAAGGTTQGGAVAGQPLPSMAGQTLNVNPGQDWEAQNAQDGGKNAYIESRNFRLMFYAGVGFAEHYFGDGSNGTRATSKSMERPTELRLQAYQTIIKGGYEVMFAFHLAAIGHTYDAHAVWVSAPQILEDDTASVVNSILSVIGVLPEFDIDEIIVRMLNAFSIDDPQDVLIKIRRRQKQLYQQYLELVIAQAGLDPANLDMTNPDSITGFITAQSKVIGMLTPPADPTRMPGPKAAGQFAQGGLGAKLKTRKPAPPKTKPIGDQTAA